MSHQTIFPCLLQSLHHLTHSVSFTDSINLWLCTAYSGEMYKARITRRIELGWVKQGKLSLSSYICQHKGEFLPLPLVSVSFSLLSLFLQVSFSQCISWKMQIIRKNKCMTDADVSTPTENVWNGLRIKIMQISCYGQCSRQISTKLKFLQDLWTMCKPPGTSEHKIRRKNLYKRLVCTSGTGQWKVTVLVFWWLMVV